MPGVPSAMIMANMGLPGQPAGTPISGYNMPAWGMPYVGTPIGLPGPTHLPLGGPAGLKSHTVRNRTQQDLGEPVDHMRIEVRHEPGLSLPRPVKYVEYTEKHPVYSPGELSYPAWSNGGGGGGAPAEYCPTP